MDSSYAIYIALFCISWICFRSFRSPLRGRKLAPGPRPLPIIGNMLHLGLKPPHQTFAKLSKTYGPLMSVRLGGIYAVVVSSPEMAGEMLHKHGQVYGNRAIGEAGRACGHDKISIVFLPAADTKWRDMRKICKEQIFGNQSLEGSQELREEKLQQVLGHVQKCCDAGREVDIRDLGFTTMLNLMTATLFSYQATEFESEATLEFKQLIEDFTIAIGSPNMADFFPILKPFDPQRVRAKSEAIFGKLLAKIDGHMQERLESRKKGAPKKNDFLETLVDISEGKEYQLTLKDVRHLLLDIFVGGAETANTTLMEWTMSELLDHPDVLRKVKEELRSVVGENNQVLESHIPKLSYMQAVIKEVIRCNPPGPLLLPRAAVNDQEINGYFIPKGTQIVVNVWAMARDPKVWPNPERFDPERFVNKKTDFKGQDFELIPFGAGRRMCPGVPLTNRILHMTTATLVHNFDWKLAPGAENDINNKEEMFGLALRRTVPLRAIPTQH